MAICGVDVIISKYALEVTNVPVKEHKIRMWHLRELEQKINCRGKRVFTYHDRISKKWIKRFGYVKRPTAYRTPYGIICHPELVDEIREDDIVQV